MSALLAVGVTSVEQLSDEEWSVTYPCGGSATIRRMDSTRCGGSEFTWDAQRANDAEPRQLRYHASITLEGAIRAAWCEVRPEPSVTGYRAEQFTDCERLDATEFTKQLRCVLKRRTGRTWSVKVGSGTAYGWLTISAPPSRLEGYEMTPDDESLLSATLGEATGSQHVSIPPTSGYRHWYLLRAAGLPTDSIELQEHAWTDN